MEQVFVVRRSEFFGGEWPKGYTPFAAPAGEHLLQQFADRGSFVDRDPAETDPALKQLIPYCVIRRPGQVFCVQRKPTQSEARLHGLLSIGLGGHVNPSDSADPAGARRGTDFFLDALLRELDEELHLEPPAAGCGPALLGILNDDSTAVGRVHLGLVYALDLPAPRSPGAGQESPRVREISKMVGGFRSLVELQPLWQDPGRFEPWSRVLLEAGVAGLIATSSMTRGFQRKPASGREESNNG